MHISVSFLIIHKVPIITETMIVLRCHIWASKNELINDVLLWTPSHRRANVGRPARTYLKQLYADIGCSQEDLPKVIDANGEC